jgi:hypothetical protein
MVRSRRPRITVERTVRVQRRYAVGSTLGSVSNAGRVARLPRGRTGRTGAVNFYSLLPRHQFDLLKMEGEAPVSTYTLSKLPMKQWPHVVIGNVHAIPGVDFTRDGKKITFTSAARLATSDRVWATYDWLVDPPEESWDEPTVVGTPYTWWEAGINGGNRWTWVRIEGLAPGDDINFYWKNPDGSEQANYGAGNYGNADPAGDPYMSTIWFEKITRPYYGIGETPPAGLRVVMNRETASQAVLYDGPEIVVATEGTGHYEAPPAGYAG